METVIEAVGAVITGVVAWVAMNLVGAAGYALLVLALVPLIFVGVGVTRAFGRRR